jgi:hypothetical protein
MQSRNHVGAGSLRWAAVCLSVLAMSAAPINAAEVTVKNDAFVDGGLATIVGGFAPGEHGGVRLTSSCDGHIVAVQILWLANDPGAGQILQRAIHIYDGSTFPTPGAQLAILEGPVMSPGFMNEFRYLDEAQTMPLDVPVTYGQQFYVTLEFEEYSFPESGSVVRDMNGCQSGKNVLYDGSWHNFCSYIAGDLVIRAVINCTGTGACCLGSGCIPTTQTTCLAAGGVFAGGGTTCVADICTAGACCLDTGGCVQNRGFQCTAMGGTFQGPGSSCSPNPCPQPGGACCFGEFCFPDVIEADCNSLPGVWLGALSTCGPPNPCTADPCSGVTYTLGDVNGVGGVNGNDVQAFVDQYISATPGSTAFCAADMCADGVIDNLDLTAFVACLLDPATCGNPNCP